MSTNPLSRKSLCVDGPKLKSVREKLCLTQQEAARISGYSARLIRKLESGGPVSRDTLSNVITAYNESLLELKDSRTNTSGTVDQSLLRLNDFLHSTPKSQLEQFAFDWYDKVFNERDLAAISQYVHEDVVLHGEGKQYVGIKEITARIKAIHDGFFPLKLTIEKILVDGNAVAIYWHVMATHSGSFYGIAPTMREIEIRGSTLGVIAEKKFVEARDHWEVKELIDQIT